LKFYRYEEVNYHEIGIRLNERVFELIKETPKGYWIDLFPDMGWNEKKWVSSTAKKRYAYPTKEEALSSFIARKERQIEILKAQLSNARIAHMKGKELYIKETSA